MKRFAMLAVLALAACRAPVKDNPVDEMLNWKAAETIFATAVEGVTAAGRAGEISRAAGRRIAPLVDEGNELLKAAYAAIANTPPDQDPVFDPDATHRLLRVATRITAQLAVEKADTERMKTEIKENH